MPRYFFDILHGELSRDEEGRELADLAAAEVEARNAVMTVAADLAPAAPEHPLMVIVRQDDERPIYVATMVVTGSTLG